MPVLPLVASRRIFPGHSFPARRPSATMLAAARSLTDPPGLYHSALPRRATPGRSRVTASRRSRGVFPIRSIRLWPRVSPSPEAASLGSRRCSEDATAADLVELYAMVEPDRRDQRNVLCSPKQDM